MALIIGDMVSLTLSSVSLVIGIIGSIMDGHGLLYLRDAWSFSCWEYFCYCFLTLLLDLSCKVRRKMTLRLKQQCQNLLKLWSSLLDILLPDETSLIMLTPLHWSHSAPQWSVAMCVWVLVWRHSLHHGQCPPCHCVVFPLALETPSSLSEDQK